MTSTLFLCHFLLFITLAHLSLEASISSGTEKEETSQNENPDFSGNNYLLGIVNGEEVEDGEWPFLASLQFAGHKHFCGGSVWNGNYILTAAHCFFNESTGKKFTPQDISVYLGHTDISIKDERFVFQAAELINHEKYDKQAGHGHDIAVVKLARSIDFQNAHKGVFCACGAKPPSKLIVKPTTECWVIGWGGIASGAFVESKLREVQVPLRDYKYCNAKKIEGTIWDASMLCAGYDQGGKDACQGDSGGPLMCAISKDPTVYALTGVVSYGSGCGDVNKPGFYTKVYYYLDWIAEKTGC